MQNQDTQSALENNETAVARVQQLEEYMREQAAEVEQLKKKLAERPESSEILAQEFTELLREEARLETTKEEVDKIEDQIERSPEAVPSQPEQQTSTLNLTEINKPLYSVPELIEPVNDCIQIMVAKGLVAATKKAMQATPVQNISVLEAFHDFISDNWDVFVANGFIRKAP